MCEGPAGVTEPGSDQQNAKLKGLPGIPDPRGVNAAAVAAFGDSPLTVCAFAALGVKFGVKDGDSTLRLFLALLALGNTA